MARSFASASSQYLEAATAVVTGYPFTLSCWFWSNDTTGAYNLLNVFNNTTTGQAFQLLAAGTVAAKPVRFLAGLQAADSTTAYTANVWNHACAVGTSATSRAVYLNGGSKGTSVTSATATGLNVTTIGRRSTSAPGQYLNGRMAECAVWNAALNDQEAAALAAGVRPIDVRPLSLVGYWPIWGLSSPEPDLTPNNHQMVVNAAPPQANHPPVHLFSRRKVSFYLPDVTPPAAAQNPAAILAHL
jgi:hypothetical protein